MFFSSHFLLTAPRSDMVEVFSMKNSIVFLKKGHKKSPLYKIPKANVTVTTVQYRNPLCGGSK